MGTIYSSVEQLIGHTPLVELARMEKKLGLEARLGTLEEGKQADLVLWNAPDMEMLVYRFGSNLAGTVIKNGEVVKA